MLQFAGWWRHQMETFSVLLATCAGNSLATGEIPAQRPVTRGFDVFFNLRLTKRLSKHWWGWWFETPSCPLWRHCNGRNFSFSKISVKLMGELFFVKFPSDECHWLSLMISQHWFRQWFGAIRQQAITCTNIQPNICRHMASLGQNEWMTTLQSFVDL